MLEQVIVEYVERRDRRPLEPTPPEARRQERVAAELLAAVTLFEINEAYLMEVH